MPRNQKQTVLDLQNVRSFQEIEKKQKQKELLLLINQKDDQLQILNQINKRLGEQLYVLQRKLGIDPQTLLRELQQMNEISVAFHCDIGQLQCLDHLFRAYDESSLRQKKLIAKLYSQLQDAEKQSQAIVQDNEFLLHEMQSKCKQILQIYHKGYPQDNLVSSYTKLQRETECEQNLIIREQNDYLLEHSKQLQQKYAKVVQEYQKEKESVDKYFGLYKGQTTELRELLIKVDDLAKIKGVLERKFDELSQENVQLESVREGLQGRLGKMEAEAKRLKGDLLKYKKAGREDSDKLSMEMDSLKMQNEKISKREKQMFNKLMGLQKQSEQLKNSNRSLRRELQKVKSDFEQTIKMCTAYEDKIGYFGKKQQNMKNAVEEYRTRLDQALLQKDKAELKQEQLEKLITNINAKNHDQSATLKTTFERIIHSQNQKIQIMQESRDDLQNVYSQSQLSLKNQIEKLRRECSILRQQNSKFIKAMKSSTSTEIISKMKQLQQKNDSLNKVIAQKDRTFSQAREDNEQSVHYLQSEKRDLARQLDKQRANAQTAIKELTQTKSKLSIANSEKDCLQDEILRLKRSLESKFTHGDEQKQWKVREMEGKMNEALERERNTRFKVKEMLARFDQDQEKLKSLYENRIQELEVENQQLKRKGKK